MPIYVHRNNQQLGPYSAAEVRTQLANGALSVHDHVWWQGQKGWVPLGESLVTSSSFKEPPGPARTRPPEDPRLSILAICSLAANLGCAVGSLASIVFGHMALSAMKKEPSLRGHRLAICGLIIGYTLALIYAGIIGTYIVLMPQFLEAAEHDQLKARVSGPNLPSTTVSHAPPVAPSPAPSAAPTPAPAVVPPVPAATTSPGPSTNAAPMNP